MASAKIGVRKSSTTKVTTMSNKSLEDASNSASTRPRDKTRILREIRRRAS